MEMDLKVKHLVYLVAAYIAYLALTDHWVVQNITQYLAVMNKG